MLSAEILREALRGLASIFDPLIIGFMILGVMLGLAVGLLPGLGGIVALVLLMPFCYTMEPTLALPFILSAYWVVYQGGSITAILLNIPGTAVNAATLIDGFPMTQQGKGGRAIGIAETASALGGVFGAIVLALIMPAIRPIVMAFGSPESFMLILMGISFIAVLARGSPVKGLIAAGLGLVFSFVGFSPVSAVPRYTLGSLYLWDGVQVLPLVLGLFALPEVVNLMATGGTIAKRKGTATTGMSDILAGMKDVFRHWWLVLRSSAIGTLVGIIPGAGGEVAIWVSYGHAKQTSKDPERFGDGAEEGVIAPESANNAKEGGALVPTLAFGIPGSSGMAVFLGILLILGFVPGPKFIAEHLDTTFSMVGILVFASILGSIVCLLTGQYMVKIALIPGHILGPIVLVLITLGVYAAKANMLDVVSTFILGGLGYSMMRFGYSRPALFLAYVLGRLAERYFHLSFSVYGWQFPLQPVALVLLVIIILTFLSKPIGKLLRRRRRA